MLDIHILTADELFNSGGWQTAGYAHEDASQYHNEPLRSRGGMGRLRSIDCAMTHRVRHCVEGPKCRIRYLIGFSPYGNGSHLISHVAGFSEEWTLYCSCGRPPISSRWRANDLEMYAVSSPAYDRGYGPSDEIATLGTKSRKKSHRVG